MKTTIVNICLSEYDVYIGRSKYGRDDTFGNPFIIGIEGGRDKVIKLYKEYFLKRLKVDAEFARRIIGLKGKKLGCFCKPKACHGDVIVEYLDNIGMES